MKRLLIAPLLMFLLFSCSKSDDRPESSKAAREKPSPQNTVSVNTIKVKKKEVNLSPELYARVRATNEAEIRPQVTGIILKRLFEEGSFVEKGQQLYQIDPAQFEVALQMSKGRLAEAQANLFTANSLFKRFNQLSQKNAISKQEYDEAKAAVDKAKAAVMVAKAQLREAQINLEYTKVYSPLSGHIGKSEVTPGALVTANQVQRLATVRSLDPVYLDLSLPSSDSLKLRQRLGSYEMENPEVTIRIDEINEWYPHKGKLSARELSVDEQSGSIGLRAIVPNPDLLLLPGMFVRAYVNNLGSSEQIVIPQSAIIRDQSGNAKVWTVSEDQKAVQKNIVLGTMYQRGWLVKEGLSEGEIVVLNNFSKLSANTPLKLEQRNENLPEFRSE